MKFVLLLCCLSLFCYVYADEEDPCVGYGDSCETCLGASNVTAGVVCFYCSDKCETYKGLISGDCTLTNTHVWNCSYNALVYLIVITVSSLCVCCICCAFLPCCVCVCCIIACSKRRSTVVVQEEMSEQLLGDHRREERENRKQQTKLVMEKYGNAV